MRSLLAVCNLLLLHLFLANHSFAQAIVVFPPRSQEIDLGNIASDGSDGIGHSFGYMDFEVHAIPEPSSLTLCFLILLVSGGLVRHRIVPA